MVTHYRVNFIMLISNLSSVRSSRYKPNVGSRVIRRLSPSSPSSLFLFFFPFFSHTMSFFCQMQSSSLASYICTATKTTTTTTPRTTTTTTTTTSTNTTDLPYTFSFFPPLFVSIRRHAHIRFIRSPSGERRKGRKGSHLCHNGNLIHMHIVSFSRLFFASVIFSFSLSLFLAKWLRHKL
jgi:hypothetical protein